MSSRPWGHGAAQPHPCTPWPEPQAFGSSLVCLWSHSTPPAGGPPKLPLVRWPLGGQKDRQETNTAERNFSAATSACRNTPSSTPRQTFLTLWIMQFLGWIRILGLCNISCFSLPGVSSLNVVVTSLSLMGSVTPWEQGNAICHPMWLQASSQATAWGADCHGRARAWMVQCLWVLTALWVTAFSFPSAVEAERVT